MTCSEFLLTYLNDYEEKTHTREPVGSYCITEAIPELKYRIWSKPGYKYFVIRVGTFLLANCCARACIAVSKVSRSL